MRVDLFVTSVFVVISILICVSALTIGILVIVRGIRRRIREAKIKGWLIIIAGFALGILIFCPSMGYLYTERLWFKEMGYTSVFWRMVNTPWSLFLKFGLIAGGFLAAKFFYLFLICFWFFSLGGSARGNLGEPGEMNKLSIFHFFRFRPRLALDALVFGL